MATYDFPVPGDFVSLFNILQYHFFHIHICCFCMLSDIPVFGRKLTKNCSSYNFRLYLRVFFAQKSINNLPHQMFF